MVDFAMLLRQSAGQVLWRFLSTHYGLYHAIAVGLIILYMWPYWILGQDVHVLVHDQLDSIFISIKVLAESGMIFAHPDTHIPAIGNDVTRSAYPSPFYGVVWLFKLLGAFEGYVAAQFFIRLIAYWGMYRLLSRHFITDEHYRFPSALAAISFACLPHYSLFGLSIAGQPLFFSSLLAIRAGRGKVVDWMICVLLPMWFLPALGGLFTLIVGGLIWCASLVAGHSGVVRLFWALVMAGLSALIVEYQMVMVVLGLADGFVSHRTEFHFSTPDIHSALADTWYNFKDGQYHAPSLQSAVIIPAAVVALAFAAWGRDGFFWQHGLSLRSWFSQSPMITMTVATFLVLMVALMREATKMPSMLLSSLIVALAVLTLLTAMILNHHYLLHYRGGTVSQPVKLLTLSLLAALAVSFWYAFWPLLWSEIAVLAPEVPYLNLSRFHYMHPMLWSMVLAGALAILWRQSRTVGVAMVVLVITLQASVLVKATEYRQSMASGDPTFREFFSPVLFNELTRTLGDQERISAVVSVGLHPTIAAYNDLRTLDGYLANYPLSYKKEFRDIISGELDRDANYQQYFDNWGSRFYIFAHDLVSAGDNAFTLSKEQTREGGIRLNKLYFNTKAFTAMGGSHVISVLSIGNARDLGLELISVAEHPASPWRLFVYRAKEAADEPNHNRSLMP